MPGDGYKRFKRCIDRPVSEFGRLFDRGHYGRSHDGTSFESGIKLDSFHRSRSSYESNPTTRPQIEIYQGGVLLEEEQLLSPCQLLWQTWKNCKTSLGNIDHKGAWERNLEEIRGLEEIRSKSRKMSAPPKKLDPSTKTSLGFMPFQVCAAGRR